MWVISYEAGQSTDMTLVRARSFDPIWRATMGRSAPTENFATGERWGILIRLSAPLGSQKRQPVRIYGIRCRLAMHWREYPAVTTRNRCSS